MSKSQSLVLAVLSNFADNRRHVASMSILSLMEETGMGRLSLRSRLWELVQAGCIERLDRRAPEGETGRLRITGKPAPPSRAVPTPAAAVGVDEAKIARRLRQNYGIEVTTRVVRDRGWDGTPGSRHVPMSLPRVRFLEDAS